VGTLIIQVLGLGSKPQFWFLVLVWFWTPCLGINWWACMCVCDSAVSGFLSGSGFFLAQSFEEGKKSSQSFMLPFDPLTVKHQFGCNRETDF
jgi:hypothetical protein